MKQCLRITFSLSEGGGLPDECIRQRSRELHLEGVAQIEEGNRLVILVCGLRDDIEEFLDALHREGCLHDAMLEPLLSKEQRAFRGVFRIIQ